MQQITRANLKTIYDVVCQGWQKKITDALNSQPFVNEISVADDVLETAYAQADPDQKKLLRKFFTFAESVFEKIQSIEDVYKLLGIERKLPFPNPSNKLERYLNACYDIPHITKAYNGNVVLDWNNSNQNKYFLYWKKNSSGAWVLHAVYCYCYSADLGFGCYFANRDAASDAASKFKTIFTDHLPE